MSTDSKREALDWSAPYPPNSSRHYDHVVAETPLGRIAIEWKSWKDYPGFTAVMPWEELISANSLAEAKAAVQSAWNGMVSRLTPGWMPRPEPGSTDSVIAAFRIAAEVIAADEDRLRKLRVFADYWPTIDAYDPPPEVAEDVSEIVRAMVVLADALRAALNTGAPDAE